MNNLTLAAALLQQEGRRPPEPEVVTRTPATASPGTEPGSSRGPRPNARVGRFACARAEATTAIEGVTIREGVLVVQPDTFGLKARVLAETDRTDADALRKVLQRGASRFVAETKDSIPYIRTAEQNGYVWQTGVPVTDPHGPPE